MVGVECREDSLVCVDTMFTATLEGYRRRKAYIMCVVDPSNTYYRCSVGGLQGAVENSSGTYFRG